MHAVWLKNHTFTHRLGKKMPYEMLYNYKPSLTNVPVWGYPVRVHNTLGTKLNVQVHDGHWVEFDPDSGSDGHQIYYPDRGTIRIEQSIIFP